MDLILVVRIIAGIVVVVMLLALWDLERFKAKHIGKLNAEGKR